MENLDLNIKKHDSSFNIAGFKRFCKGELEKSFGIKHGTVSEVFLQKSS